MAFSTKSTLHLLLALCVLPIIVSFGEKYNILILLPMAGKSHKNVFVPLMEGLAARGHDVTVVSPYKPTKSVPNLKEIALDEIREQMESNQKEIFQTMVGQSVLQSLSKFTESTEKSCKYFLDLPLTKEMIAKGKTYDLVIVMSVINECPLVVATLIGKTVMYLNPAIIPSTDNVARTLPSILPNVMSGLPSKMNFVERLKNAVTAGVTYVLFEYMIASTAQKVLTEMLPDAPTLREAKNKVALYMYNCDPVLVPPHPGMPNIVAVGAMHCKDAQPLPKEFEDFIQSSGEHGFIYFSLGSNAPSKYLPEETKQAFLTTFARLKQKVIWKFEDDLPNKPDNVMTTKWAPQQDILGHPKIRLFITHGGMLSLQETTYHGVPVVGIALFGDQPTNMVRVQELKIGEKLDFANLTADVIYTAVTKVLNDKSYMTNMKKYSAILRDQPQKPLDRAIFWTEYIIRHNGAPHLRPVGQDLNFFQYYLIDVAAFLLSILGVVLYVLCKGVKIALNYGRKRSGDAATKKMQ